MARITLALVISGSIFAKPVEWGFDANLQIGAAIDIDEQLFLRDTSNVTEPEVAANVSGRRLRLIGQFEGYYQNFAFFFEPQFYLSSQGIYEYKTDGGSVVETRENIDFSSVNGFLFLLKYRFFSYGDRAVFTLNGGYLIRNLSNFSAFTAPISNLDRNYTNRFFIIGLTFEPTIYSFNRFDLTMPINILFGPGHVSGEHLLAGLTDKKQFMAELSLGVRLQYEPRGPYALVRISWAGYRQPFERGFDKTEIGQTEAYVMMGAGFFFKSSVFNQTK